MGKKKDVDNFTKTQIMHDLLTSANSNGKLQHGFINEIAKKYDLHRRTIGRIWRQIRDQKKTQFTN